MTTTAPRLGAGTTPGPEAAPAAPPRRRRKRQVLPYVLLLPVLAAELLILSLIHI